MWVVLLACTSGGDDSDADTEGPVDSDVGGFFVLGDVTLQRTDADVVTCDATYDLLATGPYTGDCPSCDFAFAVEPQVDATLCDLDTDDQWLGLWPDPDLGGRWVGWAPERRVEQGADVLGYVDVLMVGGEAGWRPFAGTSGYWVGDTLEFAYPYGPGTVSAIGDTLVFDVTLERVVTSPRYGEACGPEEGDAIAEVPSPDFSAAGALLDAGKIDVWTVDVPVAGAIGAAVASPAVAWLQVVRPDGCFVSASRLAGRVFFAEAGVYTLVVGLGAPDVYTVNVAGTASTPLLAHDEAEPWDTRTVRTVISGSLDRTSFGARP